MDCGDKVEPQLHGTVGPAPARHSCGHSGTGTDPEPSATQARTGGAQLKQVAETSRNLSRFPFLFCPPLLGLSLTFPSKMI